MKEATLVATAQEAAARMRSLHEAMDSAKLASKGGLSEGTGGLMTEAWGRRRCPLAQVDRASTRAADAIIALGKAKEEAQDAAARVGKALGKPWQVKMDELMDAHKALPDVVAELRRLDPKDKGKEKGKKPK